MWLKGKYIEIKALTRLYEYVIGNLDDEDGIDADVVLNQVITDATIGDVRYTFTTNLIVSGPWTRGDVVEVTTTEQFMDANLGEGNYLAGQLTVLSTTGDRVLVNADTGDALTWSANVITDDNEVSISGSWADIGLQEPGTLKKQQPAS